MLGRCLAPILAVSLAFGGDPILTREGAYWTISEQGTVPVVAQGRLTVRGRGPVTVQGGETKAASYVLKKKVRAATAAEARRLLQAVTLRTSAHQEAAYLTLASPRQSDVSAELEVRSPSDIGALTVETNAGDIQVYDIAGAVKAETNGGFIQMDRIGRDVSARTAGGELRFGRLDGSARCFSGGGSIHVGRIAEESWFETAGGEIYVRESLGPLHVSTAGGNIRVDRASESVYARTAGGRIDVQRAGGLVFAGNTGGSIQVGAAQGVRCESTGGSIRLKGSSGALRAVSDVGNILAELLPGVSLQDSVLATAAGDITVFIPSNLALTIKALNESGSAGRIVSEFSEIPVRRSGAAPVLAFSAEGALNGGGPLLQISSAGGTIYLRRAQR